MEFEKTNGEKFEVPVPTYLYSKLVTNQILHVKYTFVLLEKKLKFKLLSVNNENITYDSRPNW